VNESEWLAGAHPASMLAFLKGKASGVPHEKWTRS
jgi:hypothetical protein